MIPLLFSMIHVRLFGIMNDGFISIFILEYFGLQMIFQQLACPLQSTKYPPRCLPLIHDIGLRSLSKSILGRPIAGFTNIHGEGLEQLFDE